jgi:hypothetical protein
VSRAGANSRVALVSTPNIASDTKCRVAPEAKSRDFEEIDLARRLRMTVAEEKSMSVIFRSILMLSLLTMIHATVIGQQRASAADAVDELRLQLIELQEKEGSLRMRAQQLEEELKPENIERSLAGIGSTRPEELREARRRQLTIEQESVKAQLKLIETTKARLETAIASAEGRAYQESALPLPSPPVNALRIDSIGISPTLIGILALSFVVSLATVIFTVKGANR